MARTSEQLNPEEVLIVQELTGVGNDKIIYKDSTGTVVGLGVGTNLSVSGGNLNASGGGGGVSDGDKGDITVSGSGSVWTIDNDVVTYGKIQNTGANSILGRVGVTSGDISEIAISSSQLFGRGSTGDISPITLGTNLSMSGTTLNASGGGGSVQSGTFACDFGNNTTQIYYKTVTVTDANVTTGSKPVISVYNAGSRDPDELELVDLRWSISSVGTGTFDVYVSDGAMQAEGSYNFQYILT